MQMISSQIRFAYSVDRSKFGTKSRRHCLKINPAFCSTTIVEIIPIPIETYKLGFIGAGKMVESIAKGVAQSGVLPPSRIRTAHSYPDRCSAFESFGVKVFPHNNDVLGIQQEHAIKEMSVKGAHTEELKHTQLIAENEMREKTMQLRNEHDVQMKALRTEHEDECKRLQEELNL
ncbi:pyrroline-5-carboxylate reductase-like [Euphorbia lathyris]|uniref:pyrroline-5-carboxylate reductase-like n=1 Tax=Euphorbia lathyris TaxID=212925 RepID=UPI0033135EFF